MTTPDLIPAALRAQLEAHERLAVAVSGGVDSLTLARAAGLLLGARCEVMHAAGPAVPPTATARVRRHAAAAGWALQVLNAGEYDDPAYRGNPVNRCYYCKSNLYVRIGAATTAPIAAGTNTDDLGEYRPGLIAADEHQVVHPYVAAGMNKAAVRALASALGLHDIAELPAQPCLASRVETGIAIDADDLAFIDKVEQAVRATRSGGDVRCRLTATGVWLELSEVLPAEEPQLQALMRSLCTTDTRPFAGIRAYQRGSAFLVRNLTRS